MNENAHLRNSQSKRMLAGSAISLAAFILARLVANESFPIGNYPVINQLISMGTPFLGLRILNPGISTFSMAGAYAIDAVCWTIIGAPISGLVRRPLLAIAAWLAVAALGAGLIFACLLWGMMSGSP
jgi:hypothetical protein